MSYLGNVVGGDIVRYINLPIADLKVGVARWTSTYPSYYCCVEVEISQQLEKRFDSV